jgi:hypothetical protein
LVAALALLQAFVLFSAVMWWLGSSAPSATATVAPMTWTGIVYDVGAAGVNLRSVPQVRPDDARDTAARGARLALSCGETGDVVAKGPVKTATWVRTTDGLFVSMLYVRVAGHASIPSCDGSKVDGPLLALADPAHPELPPPPGTRIGDGGKADASSDSPARPGEAPAVRAAGAAPPLAPAAGVPVAGQSNAPTPSTSVLAKAQAPAAGTSVGSGSTDSHNNTSTSNSHGTTLDHAGATTTNNGTINHVDVDPAHNPDTTPVG